MSKKDDEIDNLRYKILTQPHQEQHNKENHEENCKCFFTSKCVDRYLKENKEDLPTITIETGKFRPGHSYCGICGEDLEEHDFTKCPSPIMEIPENKEERERMTDHIAQIVNKHFTGLSN